MATPAHKKGRSCNWTAVAEGREEPGHNISERSGRKQLGDCSEDEFAGLKLFRW